MAAGGVAFDPLSGGTTTVSATAPGLNAAFPPASVDVTVSQPTIVLNNNFSLGLGGGLQLAGSATLGGSNHGGVTLRIASSNPALALVAPNATTAGAPFIDVFVADGTTNVPYVLQGVTGATVTVTVTASSLLFTDGTRDVQIVQPVLRIQNLTASTTTLSADEAFQANTGISTNGTSLTQFQSVSAAAAPLTVTFTSSDPGVGQLVTTAVSGVRVEVQMAANTITSPSSVATGGVAFRPIGAGTTTVLTEAPGFNAAFPQASVAVTVSP